MRRRLQHARSTARYARQAAEYGDEAGLHGHVLQRPGTVTRAV